MRSINLVVVAIGVLLAAVAGYWMGQHVGKHDRALHDDQASTAAISTIVGTIYLLDGGDVAGARKVLFGMGSGALDAIAENTGKVGNTDRAYLASQCRTLVRFRELRTKDGFLADSSDQALRADPGIAEAEKRRSHFLESIQCQ